MNKLCFTAFFFCLSTHVTKAAIVEIDQDQKIESVKVTLGVRGSKNNVKDNELQYYLKEKIFNQGALEITINDQAGRKTAGKPKRLGMIVDIIEYYSSNPKLNYFINYPNMESFQQEYLQKKIKLLLS